ncbi:MAG: DUF411 domain-containing protein [Hyphomicrobium sp.]|uniref:DUF411 domain-containing protein n=1 Tax=Hyphomicrobium sp. TaxID=82 RepID=UPI0013251D97|nr:DUF411 domain-containing protein [Hyphomicrobium sp.]KAB2943104.1 MAG: DUF411 domain-containing protein [Hyphomicrobium sp.]MBZ0208985.1 DUF411 domain-containing protein [Hyphomicrobium sp.]MCZ7594218.1 DUF411 domain-containing protein [Hyphomicrobium sp.]
MVRAILMAAAFLAMLLPAAATELVPATLYKNPSCKCCDGYANYLRSNGFRVTVIEHPNMTLIKQKHGVRDDLESCHTVLVDGYVVEGHVPVGAIRRLLTERPAIKGIALPGMPGGSPGMSGTKDGPFEILSIGDKGGTPAVFAAE